MLLDKECKGLASLWGQAFHQSSLTSKIWLSDEAHGKEEASTKEPCALSPEPSALCCANQTIYDLACAFQQKSNKGNVAQLLRNYVGLHCDPPKVFLFLSTKLCMCETLVAQTKSQGANSQKKDMSQGAMSHEPLSHELSADQLAANGIGIAGSLLLPLSQSSC